jgi:hypothetical protein
MARPRQIGTFWGRRWFLRAQLEPSSPRLDHGDHNSTLPNRVKNSITRTRSEEQVGRLLSGQAAQFNWHQNSHWHS